MNENGREPASSPPGYLSEQDKRKFTLITGLLGAGFFFAQFFIPLAVFLVVMPGFMLSRVNMFDFEKGAYWQGAYWFVETWQSSFEQETHETALLIRIGSDEDREEIARLPPSLKDAWPLPGTDLLWLIDSDSVGLLRDGDVAVEHPTRTLGDFSRPFFYEGRPAVVSDTPVGFTLQVYVDGDWTAVGALDVSLEDRGCCINRLQVTESGGNFYTFLKQGEWLYYFDGLPLQGREGEWKPVARVGWSWVAVSGASEPVVFCRQDGVIVGLERDGSEWATFCSLPAEFLFEMGVFHLGGERFGLVLGGFPGSVRLIEVAEGDVVDKSKLSRGNLLPPFMMSMMLLPQVATMVLPFLLVVILTILMSKHRVCRYAADHGSAPFAPIWRRAVAQFVDAAILAGPAVGVFWAVVYGKVELEDLPYLDVQWWLFGFILLCVAWLAAALLIFSFLEGRWGRTPGKWLAGIQVLGIDLKPCGFGRGLIRNALKFVDGFFNYMVGILIVALTENWQRVGDLAARTVVVQAPRFGTVEPEAADSQFVK